MEPFMYSLGTQRRIFSMENEGMTVVIKHSDTEHPERDHVQYEECENDVEAQAVITKMVFDMERGGWFSGADL